LAFFILFTLASLAVPVPLFPGNMISTLLGLSTTSYTPLFSAVTNGITYGVIVWLVFVLVTRNLDESGSVDFKARKLRARSNKKRTVKN